MKTLILFLLIPVTFLLNVVPLVAQNTYKLDSSPEFVVAGTSSIHDWTMESKEGSGKAVLILEDGALKKINSLVVEMPVKSLKSGKGQMDKNAYEALKENKHPIILFELTNVKEITKQHIIANGKLSIAGTTRPVTLKVDYKVTDNTIQFTGKQEITFTEYEMSPPTAVFGTIKTGDKLELSFQASFEQQSIAP
jgi:polyisoprenoid-binding protein YceI